MCIYVYVCFVYMSRCFYAFTAFLYSYSYMLILASPLFPIYLIYARRVVYEHRHHPAGRASVRGHMCRVLPKINGLVCM